MLVEFNPAGWSGYFTVSSKASATPGTLDYSIFDFSLIPSDSTFWTEVQSDGADIRFVDGNGYARSFALQNFNKTNKTGIGFFDSSSFHSAVTNQPLRVYAGNPLAPSVGESDDLGSDNLLGTDNGIGLWPLAGNLTTYGSQNPSLQWVDGTFSAASDSYASTGPLGTAANIVADGTDAEKRRLKSSGPFNYSLNDGTDPGISVSFWAHWHTAGGFNNAFVAIWDFPNTDVSMGIFNFGTTHGARVSEDGTNTSGVNNVTNGFIVGDSKFVDFTWEPNGADGDAILYHDGSQVSTGTTTGINSIYGPSNAELMIGYLRAGAGIYTSNIYIGLVEIREGVLTPNQITSRYNNRSSASGIWTAGSWAENAENASGAELAVTLCSY